MHTIVRNIHNPKLCILLKSQTFCNATPIVRFSGVRVTRSLVLYVRFVDRCLSFCTLAIVLSVLLEYTDSDYSFGTFKLFLANGRIV